jgi:predicted Zn finger-like uncharacterized protein
MNIQCPACHATAQLPESKEGAKVRCGTCQHIYVARDRTGRGKRPASSPTPWIIGGAGALGLLLVLFIANRGGDPVQPLVEEPVVQAKERKAPIDLSGWDSEPVVAVREIHDLVYNRSDVKLLRLFAFDRLHDAPDADGVAPEVPWSELGNDGQAEFRRVRVESLLASEDDNDLLVSAWKPFDGEVVDSTDEGLVTVRLQVQPRDPEAGVEARTIEWLLIDEDDRWRPFSWSRWISPAEQKAKRIARSKITQKKTLSDGSIVIEAALQPLEHLEDTPPELRDRIDTLYATMIDLSISPKDADRARAEIIAIGRAALPKLLTGFYEIPLSNEDEAIQVNIIVQALRDITGQYFGYKPQVSEGSGTGTSAERRDSALKQWFGWWHRKGERFTELEDAPDLYEESVIPNAQEKKMLERFKKQENP